MNGVLMFLQSVFRAECFATNCTLLFFVQTTGLSELQNYWRIIFLNIKKEDKLSKFFVENPFTIQHEGPVKPPCMSF